MPLFLEVEVEGVSTLIIRFFNDLKEIWTPEDVGNDSVHDIQLKYSRGKMGRYSDILVFIPA